MLITTFFFFFPFSPSNYFYCSCRGLLLHVTTHWIEAPVKGNRFVVANDIFPSTDPISDCTSFLTGIKSIHYFRKGKSHVPSNTCWELHKTIQLF